MNINSISNYFVEENTPLDTVFIVATSVVTTSYFAAQIINIYQDRPEYIQFSRTVSKIGLVVGGSAFVIGQLASHIFRIPNDELANSHLRDVIGTAGFLAFGSWVTLKYDIIESDHND